jgi:heme/copper-type cytochrome/quinol oxidase subunit 3
MPDLKEGLMDINPETMVRLFMLVIYIIIVYIFDRARRKFKGGTIEMVIKLIIINTLLLIASDYTHFLTFLEPEINYMIQAVLRLAAMCAIAFGGLKLIVT